MYLENTEFLKRIFTVLKILSLYKVLISHGQHSATHWPTCSNPSTVASFLASSTPTYMGRFFSDTRAKASVFWVGVAENSMVWRFSADKQTQLISLFFTPLLESQLIFAGQKLGTKLLNQCCISLSTKSQPLEPFELGDSHSISKSESMLTP